MAHNPISTCGRPLSDMHYSNHGTLVPPSFQGAVCHLEPAQADGRSAAVLHNPFQGRREYYSPNVMACEIKGH